MFLVIRLYLLPPQVLSFKVRHACTQYHSSKTTNIPATPGLWELHKLIVLLELEGGNAQISGRGTREPQQVIAMLIPWMSYAHLRCFQP